VSWVGHGRKRECELTGGANGGRRRLARAHKGKGEGGFYRPGSMPRQLLGSFVAYMS
jgi:hypothetical protein